MSKHVEQFSVKRRRKSLSLRERTYSRNYKLLSDVDAKPVIVCKKFFLSTNGFKHDQVITTSLKDKSYGEDKRGKHPPSNNLSDEETSAIKSHIFSYHPTISHYRTCSCSSSPIPTTRVKCEGDV